MFAAIPPQWVLIGLACAVSVGAASFAARAWPISMRRALKAVQDDNRELRANLESLQGKWAQRTAELAALIEEVEGALGAIEKKRRRIAATEAQAEQREQREHVQQQTEDPYLALTRRARAAGHPV